MKISLILLALAAIFAVSFARPQGDRDGAQRGRGGPKGRGHRGHQKRQPCKLELNDGTSGDTTPCLPGGLFVCEDVDLSKFDDMERKPRRLENVTALGFCKLKTCNDDAECQAIDSNSVCSVERIESDSDAIDALKELCFPDAPTRPECPGKPHSSEEDDEDADDDVDEAEKPKRCSIPPAMLVAKRACSVEYDGKNFDTPCRGRKNAEVQCNETAACTVNFGSQEVALHFCEQPERPAEGNGQRPSGGDAQPLTEEENAAAADDVDDVDNVDEESDEDDESNESDDDDDDDDDEGQRPGQGFQQRPNGNGQRQGGQRQSRRNRDN